MYISNKWRFPDKLTIFSQNVKNSNFDAINPTSPKKLVKP